MKQTKGPAIEADRNKQRRVKYASDLIGADQTREAARIRYQSQNPKPPTRLANGLLTRGTEREVDCNDLDHPVTRESFTLAEAADALGKSLATIRRWITADKLPEPYLWETTRQHRVYTVGELEVIARYLAQHEESFSYLVTSANTTEALHQAVHAYRAEYI